MATSEARIMTQLTSRRPVLHWGEVTENRSTGELI